MQYTLNVREATYALSGALDFVGIDDILHGKRVAYMAAEIAKELSYPQELIDDIICAGMLHDCGVSSTDVHKNLITELDWNNSQIHSVRGAELLKMTNIYNKYSTYIRYHHTHWIDLPDTLSEEEKIISNLIYLVDRADALRAQMKDTESKSIYLVQDTILKHSNSMFSPKLVEVFMKISIREAFWFYLEADALDEYFAHWIEIGPDEKFSFEEVKNLATMFAAVVDAKNDFTSVHSISVSNLALYLAKLFHLPQETCQKIELAGLLHDLGKLKVADNILNKPYKLNADERFKMDRHSFDSYIILSRVQGFKEIAHIASLHHETLDAKGYPYKLSSSEIPFEARIIAVADIFQALIQSRPYRHGLDKDRAYEIIHQMCKEGKLDTEVVTKLRENLQSCFDNADINYNIEQKGNH